MKKTIAVLTTDKTPGGIKVAVNNYIKALLDLDFSVILFIRKEQSDQFLHDDIKTRCKVITLSRIDIFLMRYFYWFPEKIKSEVSLCDVILTHNNFLTISLEKVSVPLITVCHSDKTDRVSSHSYIICLSKLAKQKILSNGFNQNRVFYLPHYYETSADLVSYEEIKKNNAEIVISTAGRMVRKKNFTDFIKAAKIVQEKTRPIRIKFILAGSGEQEQELKNLAKTLHVDITFTGWLNDIKSLAQSSHIFCLTSTIEPYGYILCEMMEQGVACISTRTNGPSDILGDINDGIYYEAGNHHELASAIVTLINDPDKRNEHGRYCYNRIRQDFFSKSMFEERLEEILNLCLKNDDK